MPLTFACINPRLPNSAKFEASKFHPSKPVPAFSPPSSSTDQTRDSRIARQTRQTQRLSRRNLIKPIFRIIRKTDRPEMSSPPNENPASPPGPSIPSPENEPLVADENVDGDNDSAYGVRHSLRPWRDRPFSVATPAPID
jgi:hypothetical protein